MTTNNGQNVELTPEQRRQLNVIVRHALELKLDRFLIAKDKNGFYLRETLCVIHRYELGEIHYH